MAFSFFKKKNKEQKKDERFQTLTIKSVVEVATDAVNLVFEKPEGPFDYQAGQFITLIDTVDGKKIRRAYSLCTTPVLDEYPAVTVKRVPGGAMSNHINDQYKPGNKVEVMNPMGMFTTEYKEENERYAVFFGGGSGITPLYAILRTMLEKEPKSKVALVYGNRNRSHVIFREQLLELEKTYTDRFKFVQILEDDSEKETIYHGRPTVETIGQIVKELGMDAQTECFMCGPEPMMQVTEAGLVAAGIAADQIKKESFEAGKTSPKEIIAEPSEASFTGKSQVTIILDGEEFELEVDAKTAILDAGLDANIDMPYSCQSGLCTACRGKCLEGEIDQEDAEGLSQKEIDEGYVLLCIGKPKSAKIKVEVG